MSLYPRPAVLPVDAGRIIAVTAPGQASYTLDAQPGKTFEATYLRHVVTVGEVGPVEIPDPADVPGSPCLLIGGRLIVFTEED